MRSSFEELHVRISERTEVIAERLGLDIVPLKLIGAKWAGIGQAFIQLVLPVGNHQYLNRKQAKRLVFLGASTKGLR